jgi:hypothetical protein
LGWKVVLAEGRILSENAPPSWWYRGRENGSFDCEFASGSEANFSLRMTTVINVIKVTRENF